mgnify:CR=1 FL=1
MEGNEQKKVVIELQNVKRNFIVGDEVVHALRGVSFKIHEGEFVTIMGTSGSGKSTLMNIMGCLDVADEGEYILDGQPIEHYSERELAKIRKESDAVKYGAYDEVLVRNKQFVFARRSGEQYKVIALNLTDHAETLHFSYQGKEYEVLLEAYTSKIME